MSEKITIETITPERAKQLLDVMERRISDGEFIQRPLNQNAVDQYANDMKAGRWTMNGESLVFDAQDNAQNGRHRLWAVVRAGVPVRFSVLRGAADIVDNDGNAVKLMDTFDIGRKRNIAAQLHMNGVANSISISAAVRAVACLSGYPNLDQRINILTAKLILGIYGERMEQLFQIMQSKVSRGPLLGCLSMFAQFKPRRAMEFADKITHLTDLPEGSPVLVLKRTLEDRAFGKGGTGRASGILRVTALALYHWNEGSTINSLRMGDFGVEWLTRNDKANVKQLQAILNFKGE